jgi:hypothetical protein
VRVTEFEKIISHLRSVFFVGVRREREPRHLLLVVHVRHGCVILTFRPQTGTDDVAEEHVIAMARYFLGGNPPNHSFFSVERVQELQESIIVARRRK